MNRSARKQRIFDDPWRCRFFVSLLSELPGRFHVKVHAYAIMPTHWHALIETPHANLASAIQFLDGEFARDTNRRRGTDGQIWRGRYMNCVVEDEVYWRYLYFYIHANQVRSGISSSLDSSSWCSHPHYSGQTAPPDWLCMEGQSKLFDGPGGYLNYVDDLVTGQAVAPEGFDANRLWRPNHTGVLAYVPPPPPSTVDDAVRQVELVTGHSIYELRRTKRGCRGNSPGCLACWWALQTTIESQGKVAIALGISVAAVSKRAARAQRLLDDGHPAMTHWVRMLRDSVQLKLASK